MELKNKTIANCNSNITTLYSNITMYYSKNKKMKCCHGES